MNDNRHRLVALLAARSYQEGEFRLVSGQTASYYVDAKLGTLTGAVLEIISELLLELVARDRAEAVGGMTLGADPIAAAFTLLAHQRGLDVPAFIVRKEAKGHGTRKYIEGPDISGKRVIVVDDVVTTGGSIRDAYDRAKEAGAEVVRLVSIVHRGPGEKQSVLPPGDQVPYTPLVDVEDIRTFIRQQKQAAPA